MKAEPNSKILIDPNDCPNAPDGKHRYFIYRVISEYEPAATDITHKDALLYEKVDYALSGCNCSKAIKRKLDDYEGEE